MEIDDTKKVEQMLQFQILTQIFKSVTKDSNSFGLILESLIKSDSGNDNKIDLDKIGLTEKGLKDLGYGGGEKLVSALNEVKSNIKCGDSRVEKAIDEASRKFGVDRNFILSVIKQESDFQSNTVSSAGAIGLMQLMPDTARELGVSNPYDIEQNINGGTKYLKSLLDMYGNCKELALAAYNAGPGTLQRRAVKSTKDIERLPYETRDYVNKVIKYYGK